MTDVETGNDTHLQSVTHTARTVRLESAVNLLWSHTKDKYSGAILTVVLVFDSFAQSTQARFLSKSTSISQLFYLSKSTYQKVT